MYYGTLASRNKTTRETLFHLLDNSPALRLLDVNLRPPYHQENVEQLLQKSDFVKLNDDELQTIASWHVEPGTETELIHWISGFYHCKVVCVTRGAKGAVLLFENQIYEHPGFAVNAVDTVGAGDSFLAALIAGLDKKSPRKALEYACATGAFVASQPGAVPEYSEKNIQAIINSMSK